jgi:hypothetical protein
MPGATRGNRMLAMLVFWHRWVSVVTCLMIALWFASGAVMLFVAFPSLPENARLDYAQAIDLPNIAVAPGAVAARFPDLSALRLLHRDGRDVYVADLPDSTVQVIDARTAEPALPLGIVAARRIAEHAAHWPVRRTAAVNYDQWVVHQGFDARRPYFRVSLADPEHTDLYVSVASGEIMQRTTRRQRAWNYPGAVIHWIYFTPVRKDWSAWDRLVWSVSLLALAGASVGMGLGLYRFAQSRRARGAGFAHYRRWHRWHHILGVCGGAWLLAWLVSGWLSMDHGRLFSRGLPGQQQIQQYYGLTPASAAAAALPGQWQPLWHRGYTELQFRAIGGHGLVMARGGAKPAALLMNGEVTLRASAPDDLLKRATSAAWPGFTPAPNSAPRSYYRRAEDVAADTLAFASPGAASQLLLLDRLSGEPLAILDASRRRYAWLYYGLHTWRLPGVEQHNDWRRALMLAALAAGCAMSVTGLVLATRRLRTQAAPPAA